MFRWQAKHGFTLIELVIIIVIIGVLATVAVRSLAPSIDAARYEHTKTELAQLAEAITGNPNAYAGGSRTHFGYVGDVGALPSSLDDLVSNPGGYATWNGPYIETGPSGNEFKTDAWGVGYVLADTVIRSVGSGSPIEKLIANSTEELTNNAISGWVYDADRDIPMALFRDSLVIELVHPDGLGNLTTVSQSPTNRGQFNFTAVPIGQHSLRVIWLPTSDTIEEQITVYPGTSPSLEIVFPADLF